MKRALRILVAHNVSRERTGGMSRLMGFAHDQLVSAGHSVDYFCSEDVPRLLQGPAARFAFPLLVLNRVLAAAQAGHPYDLANVHEPSGSVIALLKSFVGPTRVVAMSYGVEKRGWERALEEINLGRETARPHSRFSVPATILWQSKMSLLHADHVFCSNMEDHAYLTSEFNISATKVTRIQSGAHKMYSEAGAHRDYSRTGTLLFAASWLKRKGILDLIPAFAELAGKYSNLKLIVLNPGVPEHTVRECFPEGVRSRVTCQSAEPESGIVQVLSAADIYLLPSLFEGTPLTLIEAMFAGLPIVTTATCGMRDVISNGRNGLLVPLRSPNAIVTAVELLLNNVELRKRLGQEARHESTQLYTWERVAEPILQVYEELCA